MAHPRTVPKCRPNKTRACAFELEFDELVLCSIARCCTDCAAVSLDEGGFEFGSICFCTATLASFHSPAFACVESQAFENRDIRKAPGLGTRHRCRGPSGSPRAFRVRVYRNAWDSTEANAGECTRVHIFNMYTQESACAKWTLRPAEAVVKFPLRPLRNSCPASQCVLALRAPPIPDKSFLLSH